MDLDKTFCASNCRNYECPEMLRYRHACTATARKIELKTLDFSDKCKYYKAPPDGVITFPRKKSK